MASIGLRVLAPAQRNNYEWKPVLRLARQLLRQWAQETGETAMINVPLRTSGLRPWN